MIIPQSCAAVVAGVVTTLTAQLVCLRKLPSGAAEWGMVAASGVRMLEEDEDGWEGSNQLGKDEDVGKVRISSVKFDLVVANDEERWQMDVKWN